MRALFFLLPLLGLSTSGCTAARATYHLVNTERAWDDALDAGADSLALYEYTLARLYRDKAWEEWGYSDYQTAEELALEATQYCQDAERISIHGEEDRELLLPDDLPELPDAGVEW